MPTGGIDIGNTAQNPIAKFSDLGVFVNLIFPLFTAVAAMVFLGMLLYGAFTYATSGGNPEKTKKASKIFTFSVVGIIIITFAYFFVKLITSLLHISTPLP